MKSYQCCRSHTRVKNKSFLPFSNAELKPCIQSIRITFQTVFLSSFLPIDKISLCSLAFNPPFTCFLAQKLELISQALYPHLFVWVFLFFSVCALSLLGELFSLFFVCVYMCLSPPFYIRDSLAQHDIVPLPGAQGR